MANVRHFKCPDCGAYIEFDPASQQFVCPYCGGSRTKEELDMLFQEQTPGTDPAESDAGYARSQETTASDSEKQKVLSYHCQNCGAEIVTSSDTTAAVRCYFCHNPVVLTDRLKGEFEPDRIIPFRLTKEQARAKFEAFLNRKRFLDRNFLTQEQLEDFSGVYYPYWYGDIEGEASFTGEGTRVDVRTTRRETVTTTRYYQVEREGRLFFRNMMRKALKKNDRKLADGIHPFEQKDAIPFSMDYLSGFLAEKRDVEKEEAVADMTVEVRDYAHRLMSSNDGYNSLTGTTNYQTTRNSLKYMLLPVWVLTYRGNGEDGAYYYMMNGQTGRVCGKLPIDKKKLWLMAAGLGLLVTGLLCLGGWLLW